MEKEVPPGKSVPEDIFSEEYDKWIWPDASKNVKGSNSSPNSEHCNSRNPSSFHRKQNAERNNSSSDDEQSSALGSSCNLFKSNSLRKWNLSADHINMEDASSEQSRQSHERLSYADSTHLFQSSDRMDYVTTYKKTFDPLPGGRSADSPSRSPSLHRSPFGADRSFNFCSRSNSKELSPGFNRKSPQKDENIVKEIKSSKDTKMSPSYKSRSRSISREKKLSKKSKSRSRSRSRERRKEKSSRRNRSRDRHYDKDRKPSSRGRSRRSRSRDGYRRSRSRSHDRRRDRRHRYRSRSRERYYRRRRSHSHSRSRSHSRDKSKGRSGSSNRKPGSLPLSTSGGAITPQMALQQTMAAMNAKAQAMTGIALPKYYNPAAVNPLKYAEQVQKRKLLWQTKEKVEEQPKNSVWDKLTFAQDQDGKMTAKFRKLMGIKSEGAAKEEEVPEQGVLKKQEELFRDLDQQYEMARVTTHTQRGVGLGYSAQAVYPPVQK